MRYCRYCRVNCSWSSGNLCTLPFLLPMFGVLTKRVFIWVAQPALYQAFYPRFVFGSRKHMQWCPPRSHLKLCVSSWMVNHFGLASSVSPAHVLMISLASIPRCRYLRCKITVLTSWLYRFMCKILLRIFLSSLLESVQQTLHENHFRSAPAIYYKSSLGMRQHAWPTGLGMCPYEMVHPIV